MRRTEALNRIIHVSIVEPSGMLYGSELALLEILEGLSKNRFAAEVLLPSGSPFSERLKALRIPFSEMLRPMAHRASRVRKLISYFRLSAHWRRNRPDLIYVNQGGILRPIAVLARLLDLPVLCQVQTLADAEWVSGVECGQENVCAYVCNSQFVAGHAAVPKDKLCVLYQGYKRKGYIRRQQPLRKPVFEIGLIGRICDTKGHYLVLEAARHLRQLGNMDFHFRFIGEAATEAEAKRVKSVIANYGVEKLVELRGYRTEMGQELAELDLLAIPSINEGLGRVFFEAAEAGVPVLASDQGGLGEVTNHFSAGIRFKAGDVGDFLRNLQAAARSYEPAFVGFNSAASRMLSCLEMKPYLQIMDNILKITASRCSVAVTWRGEPPVLEHT